MIELKNFSYSYKRSVEALHDINLTLGPGMHLLLGENGSGKTTLLHAIAGLRLAAQPQSLLIDGVPTAWREPSTMSDLFILTDDMEFPYQTVDEMVKYHAPFYPNFDADMLRTILERFNMSGRERFDRFSLGNRKKAQLAYIMSLRTRYLLLDEPANGLDISSRNELIKLMAQYISEEQTVIVSTHVVFDFENIVDSVIVLNRGYLVLSMPLWKITECVDFVSEPFPVEGAIFMEQALGRFNAIVPNTAGASRTNVDFVLLFNALQSRQAQDLLSYLKPQSPDAC